MDSAEPNRARSLGDNLALVRRQWIVLVVAVLLGAAIGAGLLAVLPKSYTATSSVLVKSITDPGISTTEAEDARTTGTINMDTESQVVRSLPVATAVQEATGSSLTPVQLAARVSVSIPPNTTIISIAFEADTASEAREGAAAFASAYLQNRASVAQDRVDRQIRRLDTEAADTNQQIQGLLRKLPDLEPGSAQRLSVDQELSRLRNRARWIDDQLLPLQTAQTGPGTVILDAQRPTAPTSPNRIMVLGSSLMLMVLLGLVAALWRDGHQGRIRGTREAEARLSVDVLGTVRDSRLRVREDESLSPVARRTSQEYRRVVHAIQARIAGREPAVLVTGVGLDSVGQEVAHTLAAAVARTGTDVTLVYSDDASVERYSPEREVGSRSGRGRRASLETTSLEAADLLVDGDVQNRALPDYLEGLRSNDDHLVLLSTPPAQRSADAQAVSPFVRLTVLVVELNRTTYSDVDHALRQLHQVGVEDVSAIVVSSGSARRIRARASESGAAPGASRERPGSEPDGPGSRPSLPDSDDDEPVPVESSESSDASESSLSVRGST